MIRSTGTRVPRLSLPATLAAVFVLAVLFIPAVVGAAESRDGRERRDEATATPVVLETATPPPIQAAGDPESDPDPVPGDATIEADPIGDVAIVPTGHDPAAANPSCPEGWINPPDAVNQAIGCLPDQIAGLATTGSGGNVGIVGGAGYDVILGGGGSEHPGHNACPEGYRLELLLQEQADGGLWWSYGCIQDVPIIPDGPGDIVSIDRS